MIIYSLWFYDVDARHLADFVTTFREGGSFYESFRRIPGHIHTDLLTGVQNVSGSCRLLSISFFTSFEAQSRAEQSAQMRAFAHWLHLRTKQCIHLGTFSHFPRPEEGTPSRQTLDQPHTAFTPMDLQR
jgi:hypothetical protein